MGAVMKVELDALRTSEDVRALPDAELLQLHHRLHQLYGAARARGEATEYPYVNLHVWVVEEMERRGMRHNPHDALDRETERLRKGAVPEWIARALEGAQDMVLVPAYVSVVGSAVAKEDPGDLDVLVREDHERVSRGMHESLFLLVRKLLDPEKRGLGIHMLYNAQGPHLAGGQGYVPLFDLVLRPRREAELVQKAQTVTPIATYQAQKPMMAGYTDFTDIGELWRAWGEKALAEGPVLVSPKVDGFRTILQRKGERVSIRFEDLGEERADALPQIAEEIPDGAIIEGELVAAREGHWLARPQILSFLAGKEDGEPYVFLYDLLAWDGEDVHERPFSERLKLLRLVEGKHLIVLPQVEVTTKAELEQAARAMAHWTWRWGGPPVEGVVTRKAAMPYTFGPTDDYAKTKKALELKVKVVAVHRKANGYTYTGALRSEDGEDVILGDTFVSKEKLANEGDTLNVLVEELVLDQDGRLSWGKPTPIGPDRSRPAYTVQQAIDLARRFGVLKEYAPKRVEKAAGLTFLARVLDARKTAEGYVYRLGLPQPLFGVSDRQVEKWGGQPHQVVGESLPNPGIEAKRGDVLVVAARELRREVGSGELHLVGAQVLAVLQGVSPNSAGQVVGQAKELGVLRDGQGNVLKAEPEGEGGENRSEAALQNWEAHWQEAMPLSGKWLPFILHAHWRGLTKDEAQLGMEALLQTDNSLHFDLRLGTDRFHGWFGFTLFAGRAADNREELRIFRMQHDPEEKLEAAPKQFGPAAWLQVGLKEPLVVEPGGVGSTTRAYSKFFAIDHGRWRLGFARQHAVELWLDGQHLKGRYMLQYAEMGGRRTWLLTRPEDQRPYAQTHKLDDVVDELRQKRQRWLVWPKDPSDLGKGMELIDVSRFAKIVKAEEERRYTLAVAYPANEVDAHGATMTPEDLEQAAWDFLRKSRKIGLMHKAGTDGAGEVVESYIYRGPPWEINGERVEPGDWLLGVVWTPEAWELIRKGELTGFSIQGWGRKVVTQEARGR